MHRIREYDNIRFTGELEFHTYPGNQCKVMRVRRLLCMAASVNPDGTLYKVWPADARWMCATGCEGKAYPLGAYRVQPYPRRRLLKTRPNYHRFWRP